MKYTNQDIVNGLVFSCYPSKYRNGDMDGTYRIQDVDQDHKYCTLIRLGGGDRKSTNYSVSTVIEELNKGRWCLVIENYQIY